MLFLVIYNSLKKVTYAIVKLERKRSLLKGGEKLKKINILSMLAVIFGLVLFGCSQNNEETVSNTSISTETSTSGEINQSTESQSLAETSESVTTETTTSRSTESSSDGKQEEQETIPVRKYSEEEKDELQQAFLDWAIPRAEEGGMAVTDTYFDHGASGSGDWFAETEDGEIQVQQQSTQEELPGYDAYDIHALKGVVFYVSTSGVTGYDKEPGETHGGVGDGRDYGGQADDDYPIHKYLLGDNGVVYELIGSVEELRAYQAGFGLYNDDGRTKDIEAEYTFKVSDDTDAQEAWQEILQDYQ